MSSSTNMPSLSPRRSTLQQPPSAEALASAADEYLGSCLRHCDRPTVDEFARRNGISRRHVRRLFRIHLSVTPRQYFDLRRRVRAKELRSQGARALEISRRLGFSNVENYLRFMRRGNAETGENVRK